MRKLINRLFGHSREDGGERVLEPSVRREGTWLPMAGFDAQEEMPLFWGYLVYGATHDEDGTVILGGDWDGSGRASIGLRISLAAYERWQQAVKIASADYYRRLL